MGIRNIGRTLRDAAISKFGKVVLEPLSELVDQNLTDITTTIGSFIIRKVRGKFQRCISFTVGNSYNDRWMEEALYGILYQYNNIKNGDRLVIRSNMGNGEDMYYSLDDGTHSMKYRNFNILVCVQSHANQSTGRVGMQRTYTIITYDMSPEFVLLFEKDMLKHRNSLLQIRSDSTTFDIWRDGHENDGSTYWEKINSSPKRRLNTIYLPYETKKLIVDTVNNFIASKEFYNKHGIAHNLKMLFYSDPGYGKDSIARMIASEWNRNLLYTTGGKDGRFIPNAITDTEQFRTLHSPLIVISDIDKYPFLINEPDINMENGEAKDEVLRQKQCFGNMINALDGILSGEDKIIIMTTNHIEKFSEAFLRPGRVDLVLEIPPVTPEVFRKYVYDFYGVAIPTNIKLRSDKLRISEMQNDIVFMKMELDEFLKKYTK